MRSALIIAAVAGVTLTHQSEPAVSVSEVRRQSGTLMEILSGLSPGDRVIVTDMSAFVGYDRVRLK